MTTIKKKFSVLLLGALFSPFVYAQGACESLAFTHWAGRLNNPNILITNLYIDGMYDDGGGNYTIPTLLVEYYFGSAWYGIGTGPG